MKIHILQQAPDPELGKALEQFETQFTYPLGEGQRFRISHGADYPRFFRAIGEASCHIAENYGSILGTIGAAQRPLLFPSGEIWNVGYLGDLKIPPLARNGLALLQLAQSVYEWGKTLADSAYGIVMDGTDLTPNRYTGRIGIPGFSRIGKITILRLSVPRSGLDPSIDSWKSSPQSVWDCFKALSSHRYAGLGGNPEERSEMEPVWLLEPDGFATGRLEDTRKAKRLFTVNGPEILSAHLSCFAFGSCAAGAKMLRMALSHCVQLGFPALFVSLAPTDVDGICAQLSDIEITRAPATIFGNGLEPSDFWNINTSEI